MVFLSVSPQCQKKFCLKARVDLIGTGRFMSSQVFTVYFILCYKMAVLVSFNALALKSPLSNINTITPASVLFALVWKSFTHPFSFMPFELLLFFFLCFISPNPPVHSCISQLQVLLVVGFFFFLLYQIIFLLAVSHTAQIWIFPLCSSLSFSCKDLFPCLAICI